MKKPKDTTGWVSIEDAAAMMKCSVEKVQSLLTMSEREQPGKIRYRVRKRGTSDKKLKHFEGQ